MAEKKTPSESASKSGAGSMSEAEKERLVKSTRRFDLRRILGALFVVYGVIVTIIGIANYSSDIKRTEGIAINLWAGLSMLVLGILFFVWDHFSPVPEADIVRSVELEGEERREGEGKAS
jgi:xanthine/uracil/vitamin C permease (AzgA family)